MSKIGLLEAVDRAIEAETQAQHFYLEASRKTTDAGGAAMFRELADFEAHHRDRLEALKASLASSDAWIEYSGRRLSKAPLPETDGRPAVGNQTDAIEALRIAVASEERAAEDYRALAASADDLRGRRMFERLAEEEAMHRKLLDDQFSALANRGLWFWND